jgi:thiol-disulfide isomerase/thioredoxin
MCQRRRLTALMMAALAAAASAHGEAPDSGPAAAPPLEAADPAGTRHRLSDLAGDVVLVNFWATWCPPCLKEMPSMQRLVDDLGGDGLRVLAVNVGEDARRAAEMARRIGYRGMVLLDPDRALFMAWGVEVLPTSVLVGRRGRLRMRLVGEADWDDPAIRRPIRDLLEEPRPPAD